MAESLIRDDVAYEIMTHQFHCNTVRQMYNCGEVHSSTHFNL